MTLTTATQENRAGPSPVRRLRCSVKNCPRATFGDVTRLPPKSTQVVGLFNHRVTAETDSGVSVDCFLGRPRPPCGAAPSNDPGRILWRCGCGRDRLCSRKRAL